MELTNKDVEILNTKIGLKKLIANNVIDLEKSLNATKYELELRGLQEQLINLQERVIKNHEKVVVIFEGRDSAGKGGAIRRITSRINPRHFRIIALPKPSFEEEGQWYFQRYVNHLPNPGEIIFFDRSWYNRAIVEPAMGFCTQDEYKKFMTQVNLFEQMFTDSGIKLIKLYFSITKEEQARRFKELENDSLKKWKLSPVDIKAHELWDEFTEYKEAMFKKTDTEQCPWKIIDANKKRPARIEAIKYLLEQTNITE
ncbi:MAG: polyphosphate kinase 2 [Urechidicola sp.]|jgi:polyphosphate kinase 2|tara:strand:- start:3844 stop:4611 length:768 start_codon:yes stop_codon:yes gene_type:complete